MKWDMDSFDDKSRSISHAACISHFQDNLRSIVNHEEKYTFLSKLFGAWLAHGSRNLSTKVQL